MKLYFPKENSPTVYSHIFIYFIIWLICILFISYLGFLTLPHSGRFSENFFESFANWDGGHFLGIAKFGYSEKFQYAFFPLYPLLIRAIYQLTFNYHTSAILISIVSSFFGIQLLYKLVSRYFGKILAEKVILSLLIFPTSFYFLTAYSEGLFFFFVVATFYFLRFKKLFWATFFAALASATRLAGLALSIGLLVEVITTSGINRKNWYIVFAPLGFLIYCAYLYTKMGDPFYFLVAQIHWQRNLAVPVVSFWEAIESLSQMGLVKSNLNIFLDLAFAVFGVGFVIRAFRFLPTSWSIYSLISVLLPLFTPTLSSMPRFLLPIFPIFILISLLNNKAVIFTYQLISIMLLAVFAIFFVGGYWVS